MINKFILLTTIIATTFVTNTQVSYVPTKAAVVLAGSIVSSQNDTDTKKYKRKIVQFVKVKVGILAEMVLKE